MTHESDPATRAADVLEARLEDRPMNPLARAGRFVASFAIGLVSGGAGEDALPGLDLVVTRKESGAEVLRVAAGPVEEADRLLHLTRRDLAEMSVEQFVREWRQID